MSKQNISDKVHAVSNIRVARRTFEVLDRTQTWQPEEQVLATGLMFLVWARRYGEDPRELLEQCGRRFRDGLTENNNHIQAIAALLKEDISDPYNFCF
jgi:hypothetical protein